MYNGSRVPQRYSIVSYLLHTTKEALTCLVVGILLIGVHFLVWWGVLPQEGGTPPESRELIAFLGVRGPREVWTLTLILMGFGTWVAGKSLWAGSLIVWISLVSAYQILWVGGPFVFIFYDAFYAVALISFFVFSRKLNAEMMARLLIFIALVNVLWLPLQHWGLDPVWHQIRPEELKYNWRFTGWLDNNTNLVHYLAMTIPLASALSLWLVVPLAIPVLLATKTLPIVAGIIGVIIAKRWWTKRFRPMVLALFGLAALYIGILDPPRFSGDGVRLAVFRDSMTVQAQCQNGLVFGCGPGSFKQVFVRWLIKTDHNLGTASVRNRQTGKHVQQKRLPTHTEIYHHPSSELLKAVFELGWPVLFIITGWLMWMCRKIARKKSEKWTNAYMGASVAFMVTVLGYQPFAVAPLAVSGLMVWGILEGRISK